MKLKMKNENGLIHLIRMVFGMISMILVLPRELEQFGSHVVIDTTVTHLKKIQGNL